MRSAMPRDIKIKLWLVGVSLLAAMIVDGMP